VYVCFSNKFINILWTHPSCSSTLMPEFRLHNVNRQSIIWEIKWVAVGIRPPIARSIRRNSGDTPLSTAINKDRLSYPHRLFRTVICLLWCHFEFFYAYYPDANKFVMRYSENGFWLIPVRFIRSTIRCDTVIYQTQARHHLLKTTLADKS